MQICQNREPWFTLVTRDPPESAIVSCITDAIQPPSSPQVSHVVEFPYQPDISYYGDSLIQSQDDVSIVAPQG